MIGALSVCTLAALFSRVGTRCVHTNQTLGSKRPLDTTRGRCYYATVLVHRTKLRIYCAFLKLTYHVRVGCAGYNTSALAMPSPSQCSALNAWRRCTTRGRTAALPNFFPCRIEVEISDIESSIRHSKKPQPRRRRV